jgi:hypothetical protein
MASQPSTPADEGPAACPNCGQAFGGGAPRFCPACGQETRVRPPTLGEFMQQFGGAYLSTEGALWRTLKLLLLKPGELTVRYLAGQRKHFVLPLRLYLTISVIVLLAIRLAAQAGLEGAPKVNFRVDAGKAANTMNIHIGQGRAGMKDGQFYCNGLPQWVCTRLQRRIDTDVASLQAQLLQMGERIVAQLGSAMFVMLPAFALWMKLAWWDRRLRYTEHLVFALHLHAFWFGALLLALPSQTWLTVLGLLAVPVYGWLAVGRVYGGGRLSRLLRSALVSVLYLATLAAVVVGLSLWALLF